MPPACRAAASSPCAWPPSCRSNSPPWPRSATDAGAGARHQPNRQSRRAADPRHGGPGSGLGRQGRGYLSADDSFALLGQSNGVAADRAAAAPAARPATATTRRAAAEQGNGQQSVALLIAIDGGRPHLARRRRFQYWTADRQTQARHRCQRGDVEVFRQASALICSMLRWLLFDQDHERQAPWPMSIAKSRRSPRLHAFEAWRARCQSVSAPQQPALPVSCPRGCCAYAARLDAEGASEVLLAVHYPDIARHSSRSVSRSTRTEVQWLDCRHVCEGWGIDATSVLRLPHGRQGTSVAGVWAPIRRRSAAENGDPATRSSAWPETGTGRLVSHHERRLARVLRKVAGDG